MKQPIALALVLSIAAAALGGSAAAAPRQEVSVFAAPPDVSAPPQDAVKSASGLASKVIVPGTGSEKPGETDVVTVHYTGWSTDGKMFDSSVAREKPSMFPLNRAVLIGWRECVQLMVLGEKRRCWMPEKIAYAGAALRPKGMMVFDIELLDVRPTPTIAPSDVKEPPADAQRTASGLAYKVLRPGTGRRSPRRGDHVLVHYSGWTTNGKLFDTSIAKGEPMSLGLNDVIPGWSEGLQLMVEGERTRFWIPQDIAYKGESGSPRGMLVFDVDLIKIE
jgi:FKBP-type peptidyl-prolyl cis-trans isomerase